MNGGGGGHGTLASHSYATDFISRRNDYMHPTDKVAYNISNCGSLIGFTMGVENILLKSIN